MDSIEKGTEDKMKEKTKLALSITFIYIILIYGSITPMFVGAKDKAETISGKLYEFDKESKYEFSDSTTNKSTNSNFGSFTITGNIKSISSVNGVSAYEIANGHVLIDYTLGDAYTGENADTWYLVDDKSKKVDNENLEENIMKGAIVVQTSLDGDAWTTDKVLTNIAADEEYESHLYTSKDIQQVNGCFYRVIVAYSLERIKGSSKIFFVNVDDKEIMKCAEIYQFYLINSSENISDGTSATSIPRKELGEVVNAGKDTGFANKDALTSKDPHYGWTLGTFFVNGYTRETKDTISGTPVFLKNVGDRVTLWFNLKQDISNLNGKSNLIINEDKNGYDQYFQTDKTNMRHGTLIIRYTDFEGVKHEPVIYTDYLAANARTGANTKVELFEEGDYEVALDYEIADTSGINSYTNYRIFFTFSIRNGNCMVYPFDITSGAELQDNAITENGFKLDMAKSRYLTIDVSRTVLVNGANSRTEDVRFNRPAKDGDQYKDEGIYKFNVHNLYTDEETTKTIYVGTDSFLRALSVTRLSVKELEEKLAEGFTIGDDGKLIDPPIVEEEIAEIENSKKEEKTSLIDSDIEDKNIGKDDAKTASNEKEDTFSDKSGKLDVIAAESKSVNEFAEKAINYKLSFITAMVLAFVCVGFFRAKKSVEKKKHKESSKKNIETPLEDEKGGDAE